MNQYTLQVPAANPIMAIRSPYTHFWDVFRETPLFLPGLRCFWGGTLLQHLLVYKKRKSDPIQCSKASQKGKKKSSPQISMKSSASNSLLKFNTFPYANCNLEAFGSNRSFGCSLAAFCRLPQKYKVHKNTLRIDFRETILFLPGTFRDSVCVCNLSVFRWILIQGLPVCSVIYLRTLFVHFSNTCRTHFVPELGLRTHVVHMSYHFRTKT